MEREEWGKRGMGLKMGKILNSKKGVCVKFKKVRFGLKNG